MSVVWLNKCIEEVLNRGAVMNSERKSSGSDGTRTGPPRDPPLHLHSLSIKGFLGIDELSIPHLGRATLLVGKNGVGKTTVLDAVRTYASRASFICLRELLSGREEIATGKDADGEDVSLFDGSALFHGRDTSGDALISIGPLDGKDRLRIRIVSLNDEPDSFAKGFYARSLGPDGRVMKVEFGNSAKLLPPSPNSIPSKVMRFPEENWEESMPELACQFLETGLLGNADVARIWDLITLTDDEDRVIRAINLATDEEVDRIAVVRKGRGNGKATDGHRVVARLSGHKQPVPLKSLGDGVVRLFGVSVALAGSRDGFLLIDQAESGIHHALQREFWRMVLRTAEDNNVQVLATTHGWDCVRGFAEAAVDLDTVEGVLVRLERKDGRTCAVDYPEDTLAVAARQGIEVR